MALYQRGRVWWADYYVNGKRVQESTGTRNKREAEKRYALRISEVERGVYVRPTRTSFSELGERYMAHAKMHKRSWVRDEQMLRSLQNFFGDAMLAAITPVRIMDFQQTRI
jgi:hypothetical protein